MKPILYADDVSPPVRSILILINELDIDVELVSIDLFKGEHLNKKYLEISPMHTVPALKHNDLILNDSHAILMHLSEEFGGDTDLWPKEKFQRSKVIDKLMFNATTLFRRDAEAYTEIFAKQPTDISHHLVKLEEIYNMMETFLDNSKYMAGDSVTIADISIVATLSTVNIILPVVEAKWPRLSYWFNRMSSRPSYAAGNVPGLNKLRNLVKGIAKFKI